MYIKSSARPLTLLPGPTRDLDQVYLASSLATEIYEPANDKSIALEERRYRPAMLKVRIEGGPQQEFPFAVPCHFSAKMTPQEAAAELDMSWDEGPPVQNDELISRSMISGMLALGDGSVHQTKWINGQILSTQLMPVRLSPELLQKMHDLERESSQDLPPQDRPRP